MTPEEALRTIQGASQWWISDHAREAMSARNVRQDEIVSAVQCATHCERSGTDSRNWKVVARIGSEDVTVVIAIQRLLTGTTRNFVVTIWAI